MALKNVDDFDQFCSWSKKPNDFIEHYQSRAIGSYEMLDKADDVDSDDEMINDNENVADETIMHRVRSFKRTHKGVVNQGDRVKTSSFLSLHLPPRSKSFTKGERPFPFQFNEKNSLSSPEEPMLSNIQQKNHKEESSRNETSNFQTNFEIFVIGKTGVGKTSLCEQFLTSDSCGLYTNIDSPGRNIQQVTVDLDDTEWNLIIHDYDNPERTDDNEKGPDAYLMIYSIDDNDSFDWCTERVKSVSDSAMFIVGNKSDLERLRQVSTEKGKRLADIYNGEFFEVSTVLNHMVDNLLVQIIMEIRRHTKHIQKGKCSRSKYSMKHKKSTPGDVLMNFFSKAFKSLLTE